MRLALPAVLLGTFTTGCGLTGPDEYELGEKHIEVEQGEEFALSVEVETAEGEWWYETSPKPDASVVERLGKDEEVEGEKDDDTVGGSRGTDHFSYKAVGKGTTKIRLIECPNGTCAGGGSEGGAVTPSPVPSGSPTPGERATIHTWTVTVKPS
jgi:hypothetical protein